MKVLSVNAGSSTLKFRMYEMPEEKVITEGNFERIGQSGSEYSIKLNGEKIKEKVAMKTHKDAVDILIKKLIELKIVSSLDEIKAIGHRIVHGGTKYKEPTLLTDDVVKGIDELKSLAPLHNPAHIIGINTFKEAIPNAVAVGCFDTAFHQTMPETSYLYPVPYEWYEKYGVRKYGFHGLSHNYITLRMEEELKKDKVNLIICHIGNGASITAVKDSKCIDTSMGFTPNAGIMMGTRSGDIDYTMIPYIMDKTNATFAEVDTILNKNSGLEGIAKKNDLRDIDEGFMNGDKKIVLAVDMYTKKIAEHIAKYFIELDGEVDAICFTAGGGENDSIIRREALNKVSSLGIKVDEKLNDETVVRKGKEGIISTADSKIPVYVLGTDEELMIARNAYEFVK